MLGLFKRTQIENWEVELLKRSIMKLPQPYIDLINQVNDGLLRGVLLNASDIPGYVAFTFHSSKLKKYEREYERNYKISNIKVYDAKSLSYLTYEIYVSSGTISGYSLSGGKKPQIDMGKIDTTHFGKEFIGESDYTRIEKLFDEEEKKMINPSEIYSVFLNDKEFFHIKDLEDGDFIGIDASKIVYKITHDPVKTSILSKNLKDVLKENR